MGRDQFPKLTRRQFLLGTAAVLGGGLLSTKTWERFAPKEITGRIVGASFPIGHLLRDGGLPAASRTVKTGIAIVGAGISGLSAGWRLLRAGFKDFLIFDLEPEPGGNSRFGQNDVTAYPWGAHYLPFPDPESRAVSELLRELKVEIGRDRKGRPVYDERYVCFAPSERLFIHGRWQEGLYPKLGASGDDLRQLHGFEAEMARLRRARGKDGRKAFALPMELSSRDKEFLKLDRLSMAEYLARNGWTSERLRWYVEYGCRDDYGTLLDETSAWAGAHYFASRGEGDDDQVLTWPEGNGWLMRRLAEKMEGRIRPSSLAFGAGTKGESAFIDVYDPRSKTASRVQARAAILALPQYAAARLAPQLAPRAEGFEYAPWVVANVTLDGPPDGKGAAPAWDNVIYKNDSLGYVVATHQSLSQDRRRSVWTYYLPLTGAGAAERRRQALETPWAAWRDRIINDLSIGHPGIADRIRNIDVMVWGHGMVKPKVGFVWGRERQEAARALGRLIPGHSDLSGFSLFEEAQHRGVAAAERALALLGRPSPTLL